MGCNRLQLRTKHVQCENIFRCLNVDPHAIFFHFVDCVTFKIIAPKALYRIILFQRLAWFNSCPNNSELFFLRLKVLPLITLCLYFSTHVSRDLQRSVDVRILKVRQKKTYSNLIKE